MARVPSGVSLAALGWLYLVQGVPYGLQDKFIPVQLRARGLQYSSVSLLKVVLVPWVAKGVWAPLLEVLGGRHCWMLLSLLGLSAASYAGSHVEAEDVWSVGLVLVALNVWCAVQDVAVDGLAMEVLSDDELGIANTVQVVLYKVGCLLGGAGLSCLMELTDWRTTFCFLAFLYLFTAAWAISLPTRSNIFVTHFESSLEEEEPLHPQQEEVIEVPEEKKESKSLLGIFKEIFSTPGTLWLCAYVFLYKMGERGAINNMPLHLLDKGLAKHLLAFWNGTVCQGFSIMGSFYGGIILARKNADLKSILLMHSTYRLFGVLVQFILLVLWNERYSLIYFISAIISMCSLSFTSGVISTASFTLMMKISRLCSGDTQASHYSVLSSLEVAGKLAFATIAGFIIEYIGIKFSFMTFSVLCALPCLVLVAMPTELCHLKSD